MALELVSPVDDAVMLDGDRPPAMCEVEVQEVAPVRVDALFSKGCDIYQLHVYEKEACLC